MKSNLQNLILQAHHVFLVGPMPFSLSHFKKSWGAMSDESALIFYIDGGVEHKIKIEKTLKLSPQSLVIGDNDSSFGPMDIMKENQNCSDLAFALNLLNESRLKVQTLHAFGFLGQSGRLDHLLINIGEFDRFLKKTKLKTLTEVMLDDKVTLFKKGPFKKEINGTFSVVSLERQRISITGQCHYALKKSFLEPLSSRGLSNVGEGIVQLTCETTAFILQD